jgi:hypothetical protein
MQVIRKMTLATLAAVITAGMGFAQEKKIRRSDLPAAVEKTVAAVSKDATIKALSEETQNGKTTYEVEMIVNGHTKDVEVEPSGAIVEIEEEVAMDSLPTEVKAGLTAKTAGGEILKVESLTKQGHLVAYEAKIEKAGQKTEIQVGPSGRPLDHEE